MPRIRTIKPEFPQSESMGRISRDARLLFVLLWTLADDSGRLRGNSRMLASLLFPYDDDAPKKIDTWLGELEKQNCCVRYIGDDGSHYLAVCNWEKHQRIDKPSKSAIPEPPAGTFANPRDDSGTPREHSPLDQDQGREGKGKDQGREREGKKDEEGKVADAPPSWEIPEKVDSPEVRELLPLFEQMRRKIKKPIKDVRNASRVLREFDDAEHLAYALNHCIGNEYQGLKPEYRPASNGNGNRPQQKTFAQLKEENSNAAIERFINGTR